jgi:Transposase domain (DUF772)
MDRELLDAEAIAGDLVPAGSVFAFLASHRQELFPDSFTADLFGSATGRPSPSADLVESVLVLKELHDLSDAQTADAPAFDIRWKVACGRSLTQMSFDPSTLVYWRRRIAASDRRDRVFDAVVEVIAATGILRGRRKRCVDSTVFDDAVATQDTVIQLVAAIRRAARVVPGAADVVTAACTLDYSRPGKPPIDWDDPQARQDLVSDLVNAAAPAPRRPARRPDQEPPGDPGMIPLTVPQIKRLLAAALAGPSPRPGTPRTGPPGPAATRPAHAGTTSAPDSSATPKSPWSASEMRLPSY